MKRSGLFLLSLLSVSIFFVSCYHHPKRSLPFGTVRGTHFTEVRRIFDNGLKFDKRGYQLEPSWDLYFIADDSVLVLSPKTKKYYGFHVYFDHDSIFNMVGVWFKVKNITADSLIFQALKVENKVILDNDEGSKVYLTFYSDPYRKKHDAGSIKKLGLPGTRDTAFIRSRIKRSNTNMDSSFAAREPVILNSKTLAITVEKVKNESTAIEEIDPSDDYLAPEYNITIHKAYESFDYSFYVFVDDAGKMYYRKSVVPYMPEFRATYERIMKAIINGYLKRYLDVTPGKTLGMPHTTSILLNVTGEAK